MFNTNFTDPEANLLINRLAAVVNQLTSFVAPTKEEYEAQIYTVVNQVVQNGYNSAIVPYIFGETPAVIGNFTNPIQVLDTDATNIIYEVLDVENSISTSYNLSAAANNNLRQAIRNSIYASTQNLFYEGFINNLQISSSDGTIDYSSGTYSPQVTSTVTLSPTITIGNPSAGTGDLTKLNSTDPTQYFSWAGSTLQLIFNFSTTTPVNRLVISSYDYKDLSITSLKTTPDGSTIQDILNTDLDVSFLPCNVTSNKSAGNTTIDFNPKSCMSLMLTLVDNTGSGFINLNSVNLLQLQFSPTSVLVSNQILAPIGTVVFNAEVINQEPYSVISHYLSYDGTSYQVITPGQVITMPTGTTGYYYKAILSINSSLIKQSGTFTGNGLDPSSSNYYSLQTSTTNILGNNIISKSLLFNNINGPVTIDDSVIPNTFYIQQGSTILAASSYSFINGVLTFPNSVTNVTVVYQTNANVSSVESLLNYFGSRLVSYSFERV